MTVTDINFTGTGRRSAHQEANLLVEAAKRGDLQRRVERRWDVYLLNGVERPEIRMVLTKLLDDGVLVVAAPDAALSLVVPA
jgi:hypothetical protein